MEHWEKQEKKNKNKQTKNQVLKQWQPLITHLAMSALIKLFQHQFSLLKTVGSIGYHYFLTL